MKKYMLLTCLALVSSTLVFKASNQASIEKLDPGRKQNDVLVIEVTDHFEAATLTMLPFAVVPSPIVIDEPIAKSYTAYKPAGQVNTKYHAAWLFHPLKLC